MIETEGQRYELRDVVGVGGMGTVHKAYDRVLQREVAIKVLKPEYSSDDGVLERFRREARISASLSHIGIAPVYDFVEEDGRSFLVMELLKGRDLHQIVASEGPMEPIEAAAITAHAADALEHAHKQGAVHRDVKPGNIFITDEGGVKVTDFGIALAASQSPITATGDIIGTPFYLSPEQVNGDQATPSSDIYSLGCVLYQLVTGVPPYTGTNSLAIALAHREEPVPDMHRDHPNIPKEIADVVHTAMAKDPSDRYASASEMAEALRALTQSASTQPDALSTTILAGAASSDHETLITPTQGRQRTIRRSAIAVAALAVGILVLVLLASLARNETPTEPFDLPNFAGERLDQATEEGEELGLKVTSENRTSDRPVGEVVGQEPAAGQKVAPGSTLKLFVSDGNGVRIPNVVQAELAKAEATLRALGFQPKVIKEVVGDTEGIVVEQDPASGSFAAPGSEVRLTISVEEDRRGKGKKDDD
ncbi:MAG TPA: protein kinase [Actinomycetota bacterium]|nr:protein kinase [Actinomycetota bacterium]